MAIRYRVKLDGLYRYSAKQWNDDLRTRGSLRIGTLHDYRKSEHKPGVQDAEEGKKWVSHYIDHWDMSQEVPGSPSLHARANEAIGGLSGLGTLTDMCIISEINQPNCFIHCTSYKLSRQVMSQFEGADSCLHIYDHKRFYQTLTAAINKIRPVKWGGINLVTYQDRIEQFDEADTGITAWWIKGTEFEPQFEVRAIWHPLDNEPIDWFVIEVPELIGLAQTVKAR